MKVSEVKIGTLLDMDGNVFYVSEYQYVTNGTNTVILTKLKNIETDREEEKVFNAEDEVEKAEIIEVEALYSYSDENFAFFTDTNTKQIHKVNKKVVLDLSDTYETENPYKLQYAHDKLVKVIAPSYLDKLVSE